MARCYACCQENCDSQYPLCNCDCHRADFLDEIVAERTAKSREFPKHLQAALAKLQERLKCKKHPKYQGKRKPRAICEDCHLIWEKNQK